MDDEIFIRSKIPALMSARKVKAETDALGGEWTLHEINYVHGMPRNVEFQAILISGTNCLRVMAKLNRESEKLSITEVAQI
jgi:hypothetical protein